MTSDSVQVILSRFLRPLTGASVSGFVFPSNNTTVRCLSENTMTQALRRLDVSKAEMVPHGFRSSARTLLVERLGVDEAIVEAQLAHAKSGPLGSAYDRAVFMEQRVTMMKLWGGVVAGCARGEPFPKSAPATAPAMAPAAPRTAEGLDPKELANMIERLTGKRVSAAAIKKEAAKLARQ